MTCVPRALALVALCALCSCNLLNTADSESAAGRGGSSFDPYLSDLSPSIRLVLQSYKGCAVLATGATVGRGNAQIPYPDECESWDIFFNPLPSTGEPMEIVSGTTYHLGQLTLMDQAIFLHNNPSEAIQWITNESLFANLDWQNVGILWDRYVPEPIDPLAKVNWRRVNFSGANWQRNRESTFTVELLDQSGNPVPGASQTYTRDNFFAENPVSWHTNIMWQVFNVAPPRSEDDTEILPGNDLFGPPLPITYVRIDHSGATDPANKTITVPDTMVGDGAFKVTWSELADQPFYFPVRFAKREELPRTCLSPDGGAEVGCGFGADPQLSFSRPENGEFYQPGDSFSVKMQIRDSLGNLLHPPDELPSWTEYKDGLANGLLYTDTAPTLTFWDTEHFSSLKVVGPLQKMRPAYSTQAVPFFKAPADNNIGISAFHSLPGLNDLRTPTTMDFTLPEGAEPGTYVAFLKINRQFEGERFSRTNAFQFQVGQKEETEYPGRVGNCQICHRGVLSLENLLHGLGVDHVEGCKACHTLTYGTAEVSPLLDMFHRIHMSSDKFPLEKRDCSVCHLTRESALRPSLQVCGACHPSIHGGQFFEMEFQTDEAQPNRFSNCAQACHVNNPPSRHILPAE